MAVHILIILRVLIQAVNYPSSYNRSSWQLKFAKMAVFMLFSVNNEYLD